MDDEDSVDKDAAQSVDKREAAKSRSQNKNKKEMKRKCRSEMTSKALKTRKTTRQCTLDDMIQWNVTLIDQQKVEMVPRKCTAKQQDHVHLIDAMIQQGNDTPNVQLNGKCTMFRHY